MSDGARVPSIIYMRSSLSLHHGVEQNTTLRRDIIESSVLKIKIIFGTLALSGLRQSAPSGHWVKQGGGMKAVRKRPKASKGSGKKTPDSEVAAIMASVLSARAGYYAEVGKAACANLLGEAAQVLNKIAAKSR